MDAFLSALPGRRASFVAAAFFSGGIHLTLLFGFPGGTVVHLPGTTGPEPVVPPIWPKLVETPPEPEKRAGDPETEPAKDTPDKMHATLPDPVTIAQIGDVIADIRPELGVMPRPEIATEGIPLSPNLPGGGPTRLGPWDPSELDKRPEAVAQMAPAYPFEARNAHIEGVVMVRFIVTKDGTVESASIAATPHAAFNEPALAAVRKWKFRAGMKNGVKVATRMEIPLAFRITE